MSGFRDLIFRTRLGLFRLFGGAAAFVEPRDPAHLASRLDHGEIVWRAFLDAATALRLCGRFEEADAMVVRGLSAFPGDPVLLYEHAMSAHNAGLYAIAVDRWSLARQAAPERAMCWCGLSANLRELGRFKEAAAAIDTALARFPDDLTVLSEAARVADVRFRFDESLRLWGQAVATPNPHPEWLRGHAHALVLLGRYDEAEAALASARAAHPDDIGLEATQGILVSSREDWTAALAFWSGYRRRHPEDKTGWEHFGRAQQGAAMVAAEAAMLGSAHASPTAASAAAAGPTATSPTAPEPVSQAIPSVARVEDEALRQLMLGFESVGDNCEFGAVQRRYGAEPLGLLRWNTVTLDGLLPALEQRLDGIGLPENTELALYGSGEYMVRDRRWGLGMHTFLFAGQVDRETLYPRMCRRIAYLRDKFVADLTEADKILVYRSPGLDGDRLEALHRALSVFGPIRLLNVQPAAPTAPTSFQGGAGEVIEVAPRRYVGFLERLGVTATETWDIAFDDWVSVCRKCVALAG